MIKNIVSVMNYLLYLLDNLYISISFVLVSFGVELGLFGLWF